MEVFRFRQNLSDRLQSRHLVAEGTQKVIGRDRAPLLLA
jgi:hypothetical protein